MPEHRIKGANLHQYGNNTMLNYIFVKLENCKGQISLMTINFYLLNNWMNAYEMFESSY